MLKNIFIGLLILNAIGMITILYKAPTLRPFETSTTTLNEPDPLRFKDPALAYELWKMLDEFQPVPDHYVTVSGNNNSYGIPKLGLIADDFYCDHAKSYFIDHPEFLFKEQNFFADYMSTSLTRGKVMPSIGKDVMPYINYSLPKNQQDSPTFEFKHNINMFFTNGGFHPHYHLGKQFACSHQMYNHIPGHGTLNRKDRVAESIVNYGKQFKDRPQCFGYDKFFPETWLLYEKDQCEDFFNNYFNTEEYQRLKQQYRIVFIRKQGFGAHKAKGVDPVNEEIEKETRELYDNGRKCGEIRENLLMQRFITNPLLIQNHKFDFRIYMVIGSTNPLILYYHDGFLRLSLHEYDPNSNDKAVLLTNTDLAGKAFEEAAKGKLINGMNETELRNFQMWNFTKLQDYLLSIGKITDKNWINNYLRPQFKKAMIHLVRATSHGFLKRSQIYELFGVDFILDDDLNLWFLECNTGPVLKGTSEEKEKFVSKMLRDQFEIAFGYMRSRMKRIIRFINKLTDEFYSNGYTRNDLVKFKDRIAEFNAISKNYFEPEYEPSPDNGFHKIIDENLEGTERYAGLISEECL